MKEGEKMDIGVQNRSLFFFPNQENIPETNVLACFRRFGPIYLKGIKLFPSVNIVNTFSSTELKHLCSTNRGYTLSCSPTKGLGRIRNPGIELAEGAQGVIFRAQSFLIYIVRTEKLFTLDGSRDLDLVTWLDFFFFFSMK